MKYDILLIEREVNFMKKEIKKYVGGKIKYYRNMKGLTQKELGLRVGVKHNTISSYEKGTNEPEQEILFSIANALDVSINDFFPSTETAYEVVKETQATYTISKTSNYPYYPVKISAGLPLNVESIKQDDVEQITIPDSVMGKWAGNKDIFMLRVNGESMNNVIPHGSLIAVKSIELSSLKEGDIVVYSDGNDYSVKRFYRDDIRLIFRPDSKDPSFYDYITSIDNDNLVIHGKVVVYIVELD